MTVDDKAVILRAFQNYRGDDLERACASFRGCSPAQMQEKFGQSDKTRAEILAGYETHVERVTHAIASVQALRGR